MPAHFLQAADRWASGPTGQTLLATSLNQTRYSTGHETRARTGQGTTELQALLTILWTLDAALNHGLCWALHPTLDCRPCWTADHTGPDPAGPVPDPQALIGLGPTDLEDSDLIGPRAGSDPVVLDDPDLIGLRAYWTLLVPKSYWSRPRCTIIIEHIPAESDPILYWT